MNRKKPLQSIPKMTVSLVDSRQTTYLEKATAYRTTTLAPDISSCYFYTKYTKEESETVGQGGTAVSSKKPLMSSGFSAYGCVAVLLVNLNTNSAFLTHIDDYSRVFSYLPNDLAYAHFCKEAGKKIGILISAENSSRLILQNRKTMFAFFKAKAIDFRPDLKFGSVQSHWGLLYDPITRELSIHRHTERQLLQYQLFPPLDEAVLKKVSEIEPLEETVAKEGQKMCRVQQLTNQLMASLHKRDLTAMQQLFREPLAKQVRLVDNGTHLLTALSSSETYTYDFVNHETSQLFYSIITCCADNLSQTNSQNRDCCLKAYRGLKQTIKPHVNEASMRKLFHSCQLQILSL